MVTRKSLPYILLFLTISISARGRENLFFTPVDRDNLAQEIVDGMSDAEALGQTLMLGYRGTAVPEELLEWIREKHIGGVKIFGWNVGTLESLAESVGEMQKTALESGRGIPLLIATDQEGGWVRHVKAETSITAGNLAIGATGLPYDAYFSGYYIGLELNSLGINMNFAPTVDVYTNPDAHVIGPRAFSDDPLKTANLAVAYFHGLKKAGIISTAKHYPGHGNASVDSHGALPVIPTQFDELWETDLLPYRFLVRENIPAVMSGHVSYPNIDSGGLPATISPYFQKTLLREKLGFRGLSVTDDLLMNGVTDTGLGLEEIAFRALDAGNDIILISRDFPLQQKVWARLISEMDGNPIFRERIRESAVRVVQVKLEYLGERGPEELVPDPAKVKETVPHPEGKEFFFDLACRSVSLYKSADIPLTSAAGEKILLAGQFRAFLAEGRRRYPEAQTFYFSYDPFYEAEGDVVEELRRIVPLYDTVIFCLANPNSARVLESLRETIRSSDSRLIVFSVLTPVYIDRIPWIDSALAVYGLGDESFKAGFAVIAGDFVPRGEIPLRLGEPAR